MDNSVKNKKITCLGGGIGTVNLIAGLSEYTKNITVVISMADEGGSSGRLRRIYKIPPPGDLVSCMSALSKKNNTALSKLLTYRFPGDRYGEDKSLGGHKVGNLIMAALTKITGSFDEAIIQFQKIFDIPGVFLPATSQSITISAETVDGKKVFGEETIDRGKYNGKRVLEKIFLHPKNPDVSNSVVESIRTADVLIAGPGDLYTTILPVLIIPRIAKAIKESSAKKIFIVNVANKPFETRGYTVQDYVRAISKHIGSFPFKIIITNNNFAPGIPKKFHYSYVEDSGDQLPYSNINIFRTDLVNEAFPLYHSSEKLAKIITKHI